MRQKPGVYLDSFWGDFINALVLRPPYREPVLAPQGQPETVNAEQAVSTEQVVSTAATATEQNTAKATNADSTATIPGSQEAQEAGTNEAVKADTAAEHSTAEPATVPTVLEIDAKQDVRPTTPDARFADPVALLSASPQPDLAERQTEVVGKIFDLAYKPDTIPHPTEYPLRANDSAGHSRAVRLTRGIKHGNRRYRQTNEETSGFKLGMMLKPWRKLSVKQLRDLGFSKAEADVVSGMFRGYSLRTIANRSNLTMVVVNTAAKQLMNKFEVNKTTSLLNIIWTMHQDRKSSPINPAHSRSRSAPVTLSGSGVIGESSSGKDGIIQEVINQGTSGLIAIRNSNPYFNPDSSATAIDYSVPTSHPDHPDNDAQAGKFIIGKKDGLHAIRTTQPNSRSTKNPSTTSQEKK